MDPVTILAALLPVASDGIRGLVTKWTGGAGAKPANVEEAVRLIDADISRMKALAELDRPENTSVWVNDVRALQRPAAVALVIVSWLGIGLLSTDPQLIDISGNLAASVVFYLFGDRTYMHFKRG